MYQQLDIMLEGRQKRNHVGPKGKLVEFEYEIQPFYKRLNQVKKSVQDNVNK